MTPPGSMLLVELGDALDSDASIFALPVDRVQHVLDELRTTWVPLVPSLVRGIMNHQGRILTVFDPTSLLGLASHKACSGHAVVLRREDGSSNVAMLVTVVRGIVQYDALEDADVPTGPCVTSVVRKDDRLVQVIAVDGLIKALSSAFASSAGEATKEHAL